MTTAYWAEVAREQYGDHRKSLASLDPIVLREVLPDDDTGRTSAWEQATPTPIYDTPEWYDLWVRAVAHLPARDRAIIRAAYDPASVGVTAHPDPRKRSRGASGATPEAPGRYGCGAQLARHFGLHQPGWVEALSMAERRLACVAPAVRQGHDRTRTVAQVAREAAARQAANSAPLRGRAAGANGAATRDPRVIEAYIDTWSTAAAGRAVGVAQSTAHSVVCRYKNLPLVAAILTAPRTNRGHT